MEDFENKQESDFMIEKIKERPINRKKLLRRTIITATMAVIFGLIACLTFLILEPVFNNWLYPEEEPEIVTFPEEIEEVLPEDMLVTDTEAQVPEEDVALGEDQIQEILSGIEWSVEDYRNLYASMSSYVSQLLPSMVTVTGAISDTDWFNESYEREGVVPGVLVANNGIELLILTSHSAIANADSISVTFYDGVTVDATEKQFDSKTGLCIVSVMIPDLQSDALEKYTLAQLGSTNGKALTGLPVVVLGNTMGISGSINYGMITAANVNLYMTDVNYKLFTTDIYGSTNGEGFIFDLHGAVLGVVTNDFATDDMNNLISGIGISELRKIIAQMSNGENVAYLGLEGMDVTSEANEEEGVPFGMFVRDVEMESPAMKAGIQRGDVVVNINESVISDCNDYTNILNRQGPDSTVSVTVSRQTQGEYREIVLDIRLERVP